MSAVYSGGSGTHSVSAKGLRRGQSQVAGTWVEDAAVASFCTHCSVTNTRILTREKLCCSSVPRGKEGFRGTVMSCEQYTFAPNFLGFL